MLSHICWERNKNWLIFGALQGPIFVLSITKKKVDCFNFLNYRQKLCHKVKFSIPYIFVTWRYKRLIFQIWIIKGLRHWVAKIKGLQIQSFWQRLNSVCVLGLTFLWMITLCEYIQPALIISSWGTQQSWKLLNEQNN